MANTTNFGWETPDDTDLVKDGAAAIRTLGSAIDTSFVDLKGGTTGQYLSKASNTDLDFVWGSVAAGGFTQLATGTLSGTAVALSSISSSYKNLRLVLRNFRPATDGTYLQMKFSTAITNDYTATLNGSDNNAAFTGDIAILMTDIDNGASDSLVIIDIDDYANTTTNKIYQWKAMGNNATTTTNRTTRFGFGIYKTSAAIDYIQIKAGSGNMTSGDYILYGVN